MTWSAPKTDWDTDDAIGTTDMNRIEGNISDLRSVGSVIASAASLDITSTFHSVSGTTAIKYILKAGIASGFVLTLKFQASLTVHNNEGAPGANYANINTGNALVDLSVDEKDTYMFIFDGTYWNLSPPAPA